jgi:phage-related minor tail protein
MQPDPEVQVRSNQELSEIRGNLEELAEELDRILKGVIPNKKKILLTEENLTKAMIKIDAVDSGGDDSIRKQRKDLINRAEGLLVKVDEFKHRTKTTVPQKKA